MDLYASLILILSLLWAYYFIRTAIHRRRNAGKLRLPPGPPRLPLIGNIQSLTKKPHISIGKLSKKYGPVMSLKLGSVYTVVLSSPETVREALYKNADALSSRTVGDCMRAFNHNKLSMVWMPVSPRWRFLRKISQMQVLIPQRLDGTQKLRQNGTQELLSYVQKFCDKREPIDLSRATFIASLNLISKTFFSVDLAEYDSNSEFQEFYQIICGIVDVVGKSNIVDIFPILQRFDPQNAYKRLTGYIDQLFVIYEKIIVERLKVRASSEPGSYEGCDDMLEALLNLTEEEGSEFTMRNLKHFLADLFVAAIDTTSSTMEWAITELLRCPTKMEKIKSEIRKLADAKNGILEEHDIPNLPYLQAVMKETLRLHAPTPFLIPHRTKSDVEIGGYRIPAETQVLFNLWGMGRDPEVWKDPEVFEPERFLGSDIDMRGRDFELIPFGSGRRMCPGLPLAHRMIHFAVASLINAYDWELADGLTPETLDMGERFGLTLRKETPLMVIPIEKSISV